MKKTLIFFLCLISPLTSYASSQEINPKVKDVYRKVYFKAQKKYKYDKGLTYIKTLKSVLDKVGESGKITKKNSSILLDLQRLNNEKIFRLEQEQSKRDLEKAISKYPILQKFQHKIYNTQEYTSLENGIWYFYSFKNYYNTQNFRDVTENFIKLNNLSYKNSVIFVKDGKISFLKEYKKYKLVSDDILYGVPNKKHLIQFLKKYKYRKKTFEDLDNEILTIKRKAQEITQGVYKNDKKIEKIYNFLLKNVSYATNFSFAEADFFSGIKTFKNKKGVCEGYGELFTFMLSFNLIDSKMLVGDVLDAEDFGTIGHAWVQVGNYFYDPTFDDPIGIEKNREKRDYRYYKLPKDLFYTNRFDYGDTPKNLKGKDLEFRKSLIRKKLSLIYPKYKNKNYNILNEVKFRKKYNIAPLKTLELSDIIKVIGPVYPTDLRSVEMGGKKQFKNIIYIKVLDHPDFLDSFLISTNYNLQGYKIFKVEKEGQNFYALSNSYSFY